MFAPVKRTVFRKKYAKCTKFSNGPGPPKPTKAVTQKDDMMEHMHMQNWKRNEAVM